MVTFFNVTPASVIPGQSARIQWQTAGSNTVSKLGVSDGTTLGTYPVGAGPYGVAFDGVNIWVTNQGGNSVTKLQASNGALLGTYAVGASPAGVAFDGANVWIAVPSTGNVIKR